MGYEVNNDSIRSYFNGGLKFEKQTAKQKIGAIFQKAQNGELKPAKLNAKQKKQVGYAAGYLKLSDKERERYQKLSHIANSKSYNTVADQVKEWNKNHPDIPVISQYNIR